jgi:hypothetical protein
VNQQHLWPFFRAMKNHLTSTIAFPGGEVGDFITLIQRNFKYGLQQMDN